jgi:single-strand DNA-binding protein
MNKALIVGCLGRDPEARTTGGGMTVARLAVATNSREKVNGEYQSVTTWHTVIAFGKDAEFAVAYLGKGRWVSVEGRMKHGEYVNKDGVKVRTFEVLADRVEAVGPRPVDGGEARTPAGRPAQGGRGDDFSGDIPF